ncbi:MAG: type VI secretion system-associated FHA domain protein TagH, partial [Gammaproteobacteria bacterium]|nr:type VI secretion system-associated FHA domain protein TagH [Gammaproteobacteria bacterium]
MPLRLRIVSDNKRLLGEKHSKDFVACGGTIGRNPDNDWVLPDPHRYISGRHALIDFLAGTYYIIDTSRNGVYINTADAPVGHGHPQRLFDGDRLRLGDFDMICQITEDAEDALDDGMRDSVVRAQLVEEDDSVELQLVDERRITDESLLARHLSDDGAAEQNSQLSERIEAHRILDDSKIASHAAEDRALEILLEAAGLKPTDLAGVNPVDVLQTAGLLLQSLVGELMNLMRQRAQLKSAFRLSQTIIQGGGNNPLKFSPTVPEALQYLLGDRSESYLSSREAIVAAFREIDAHEKAVPRAMVQALSDFMERFDPEELRLQFDQGLKRNPLLAGANRLKYWELYQDTYSTLAHGEGGRLPEAFSDEFARAYEREVESIK